MKKKMFLWNHCCCNFGHVCNGLYYWHSQ